MVTASETLLVKIGPKAAGNQYGFRVTRDLELMFGKEPTEVPATHEYEQTRVFVRDGERVEEVEIKQIDLHALVMRYVGAGYLEIFA